MTCTCTVCFKKSLRSVRLYYAPQNTKISNTCKRKMSVSLLRNKLRTKIVPRYTWTCRLASSASLQTRLDFQLL